MDELYRSRRHIDPLTGQPVAPEHRNIQWLSSIYDLPSDMPDGWRINGSYYYPDGLRRHRSRQGDYVVTRPEGYVPYQSVVQPDSRHAYDPSLASWEKYPRTRFQELDVGRTALLPAARQFEFMLNRSDHFVHQPGEVVEMGIDYSQMRTAVASPPQQPMLGQYGRPVLPPGFVAPQGLMGPPPNPTNPAGRYGGDYGGQR